MIWPFAGLIWLEQASAICLTTANDKYVCRSLGLAPAVQTLVNAVISNESQIQMSTVRSTYSYTRQLCFNVRLRHRDIDKVEDITKSIKEYFSRK